MTPDHANVLLLANKKGQMTLVYTPDGKAENQFALRDQDRAYLDEILGLKAPEAPEAPKVTRPTVTELFSGASRRLQTFKDGLRSDRYAIERFDYNRPAFAAGYGAGYGYGGAYDLGFGANGGYHEPPPPPMDRRRDDYGGGGFGGGYGGGYGNGFYSVPAQSASDAIGGAAGAAQGGAGAAGGFQGGAGNFGGAPAEGQ
jgi:hypothetical protein